MGLSLFAISGGEFRHCEIAVGTGIHNRPVLENGALSPDKNKLRLMQIYVFSRAKQHDTHTHAHMCNTYVRTHVYACVTSIQT